MPGPQLLDFKLVFFYSGIKATQYFTKFTDESLAVFRSDLLTLKLPLPKKENVVFISHGHIECVWYSAPRNGVLHNNIRDKVQPTTGETAVMQLRKKLKDLSIGHIHFKQTESKSASNASTKRPNPNTQKPSNEQEGSRPSKVARREITQRPRTLATPPDFQLPARVAPLLFPYNKTISEPRSHRQPVTNPNDSTTTVTTTTLPTPPRSSGGAETFVSQHSGPRSLPAPRVSLKDLVKADASGLGANALAECLGWGSSGRTGSHAVDATDNNPTEPLALQKDLAPMPSTSNPQVPANIHQHITSIHGLPPKPPVFALAKRSRRKQAPSALSMSLQQHENLGQEQQTWQSQSHQLYQIQDQSQALQEIQKLTHQQQQKQRGPEQNQQEGQNQPQTQTQTPIYPRPTTLSTSPSTSTSNARFTVKIEPGLESERAFTPPSGYSPSERVSVRQDLFEPYSPFEDKARDQDQETNVPPREFMTNGAVTGVPCAARDSNHGNGPATRPHDVGPSPTSRPAAPSASASNMTKALAIQRLTREAWDVKRQISANIERERVIIEELEGLGSRWVPEVTTVDSGSNKKRKREDECGNDGNVREGDDATQVKHLEDQIVCSRSLMASLKMRLTKAESGHSQTQSKLTEIQTQLTNVRAELMDSQAAVVHYRSNLSQAQSSLTQERRLRKEAEDAIADVRRECVKPFVVPSLLDAFVEVSKLTTRAMVSAKGSAVKEEAGGGEEIKREKGKSVDMGPPTPQRTVRSFSQTWTAVPVKAGEVQPCHTDARGPSSAAAVTITHTRSPFLQTPTVTTMAPMKVDEAHPCRGSADSHLRPSAPPSADPVDGVSGTVGAVATLIPRQIPPPPSMSDTEDVDIQLFSPSVHTMEDNVGRPNEGNRVARQISGDADMVAFLVPEDSATHHIQPQRLAPQASASLSPYKGYDATRQAPPSFGNVHVQPNANDYGSQKLPVFVGAPTALRSAPPSPQVGIEIGADNFRRS